MFGILLLLPPTRALGRRLIMSRLGRQVTVRVSGGGRPPDFDVEGTATEYDRPPGRLER